MIARRLHDRLSAVKAKPKPESWPMLVSQGNVTVKIYKGRNRSNPLYTIAYIGTDGHRVRSSFVNLEKAKVEAGRIAIQLNNGQFELLQLSQMDAAIYTRATGSIQSTGRPLDGVCTEFAEAFHILGSLGSLKDAARFYVKHHTSTSPGKTVPEVVTEFIRSKERDGFSKRYIEDCRARLNAFSSAFSVKIADVPTGQMQAWLDQLRVGPRSRNNVRNLIITLFNFGRDRGFLPKNERTEAESLTRSKVVESEIGILKPKQLAALLKAADPDLVPFIAIGGFAGLRRAELQRLDWEQINLKEKFIRVTAENSKTGQRRLVPIQPNLASWLRPYLVSKGPVCKNGKIPYRTTALAGDLQMDWPNNALRHSYASYRLAQCQDTAKVALEMGNSPTIIFNHYRQLVTPAEAQRWWSLKPAK